MWISVSVVVFVIDWLPLHINQWLNLHVTPKQDKRLENGLTETVPSLWWAFVSLFGLGHMREEVFLIL